MPFEWVALGLVLAVMIAGFLIMTRARGTASASEAESLRQVTEALRQMGESQSQLGGRLTQLSESQQTAQLQMAQRFQEQERALGKALEERLADVSKRVSDTLEKGRTETGQSLGELKERLAVIDSAQKNIADLSSKVVSLQDILSNKQARGAFGEIQLENLVRSMLPPNAYSFQTPLGTGHRPDCLLTLPNPPGAIAIDAKFPLEAYHQIRDARDDTELLTAQRRFKADILKHIKDIREKYIVPGETAESAMMFVPSEAVYAELHASHTDVIEASHRAKVWIVSPTTMMATLNTVRAVLKDARMREQAGVIQKEVQILLKDVTRLDDRVDKLQKHFDQAQDDVRQIRISTDKVAKRATTIEEVELGEDGSEAVLPRPEENDAQQ